MRLSESINAAFRQGDGEPGWGRLAALNPMGARLESLEPPPDGPLQLHFTLRGEEFADLSCTAVSRAREEDGYWTTEVRFTAPEEIRRLRDAIARVLLTSP